jgi:excisionase family DNA binding protein
MNDEVMTIKEAAVYLKVKPVTIYKLLNQKKIPGIKISGAWRFKREILDIWIDAGISEAALEAKNKNNLKLTYM